MDFLSQLRSIRGRAAASTGSCPDPIELARAAGGGESTPDLWEHLSTCSECAELLNAAVEEPTWDNANEFPARRRFDPVRLAIAAAAVLAVVAVWFGFQAWQNSRSPGTLLAKAYTKSRPFPYRLPDHGYAAVRQQRAGESVFARPMELHEAEAEIRRRLAASPQDPGVTLWKGRSELLEGQYEAAIETLSRATADGGNPDSWTDLACAFALRAGAENRPEDYARAAELLLRSLRQSPRQPRARFNLALVYRRMWLLDDAIASWKLYLELDGEGGWAKEAHEALAEAERLKREKEARQAISPDPVLFLAEHPAGAMFDAEPYLEVAWSSWLPRLEEPAARQAISLVAEALRRRNSDGTLAAVTQTASRTLSIALADAIRANAAGVHQRGMTLADFAERSPNAYLAARARRTNVRCPTVGPRCRLSRLGGGCDAIRRDLAAATVPNRRCRMPR